LLVSDREQSAPDHRWIEAKAPSSERRAAGGRPRQPAPAPPPLAAVAREQKWFKVDAMPSYV
ncbi:hypothetical protein, partial [Nocardioides sp.]|uniref:hypothetical protein n=1 Tax=Nocardioides sp. TaxID=35761 RepID=UPI0026255054